LVAIMPMNSTGMRGSFPVMWSLLRLCWDLVG